MSKYQELQAAAKSRGLSATGTAEELEARIAEYDLLAGEKPPAPAPQPQADPTPPAPQPDPTPPAPPTRQPAAPRGPHIVSYPAPDGSVSTDQHNHYRLLAYQDALARGRVPLGGLAGVRRSGWAMIGGVKHAVYEVQTKD